MSKELVSTITLWTAILAGTAFFVMFPGFFVTASVLAIVAWFLWIVASGWTWGNTASVVGPPLVFEALRKLLR